jgi:hypothetical protein
MIKRRKPINKVSGKRKKENAEYKKLREKFLNEHPVCEAMLEGCTGVATDCHHKAGRIGNNFLDVSKFLALCSNCHRIVECSPLMAKEKGLSVSRLNK